ncbi:hypothetical protein L150_05730 [Candida albicans Ca529L]|nr:hypothetical protein L150_05730 [Candida albicans Ca529L]
MAKGKGKGKGKDKGKSVPNRDNYARISYLYQISNQFYLAHPEYQALSRGYNRNLDLIAKKTVIKLSPHIKRTLCKKCNTMLIPGLTMSMYIENLSKQKSQHNDVFVNKCLNCGKCTRFPVGKDRNYILFTDKQNENIPT